MALCTDSRLTEGGPGSKLTVCPVLTLLLLLLLLLLLRLLLRPLGPVPAPAAPPKLPPEFDRPCSEPKLSGLASKYHSTYSGGFSV